MPDSAGALVARPAAPFVSSRRAATVLVVVLFAAVFALRWMTDDVADATSLLYVLPVALSAAVFGRRAGLVAAATAIGLFTVWIVASGVELTVLGWVTRATTMVVLGDLLGVTVDRLRASERRLADANDIARLAWWEWSAAAPDRLTTSSASVVDPADAGLLIAAAQHLVAGGSHARIDEDMPAAGGRRWLHVHGEAVGAGRVQGAVQDVTDLHEAADIRRDLGVAIARHRDAVEINDSIVQALVAAKWALEIGNVERGLDAVADALATAHELVQDLLGDDLHAAPDLLRSQPRSSWKAGD